MASDGDVWHLVEARRDDGTPAMFRIRDLEPRTDQPRIFVVEMPYPVNGLSRLPDAAAYRRAAQFEEQWLSPACSALGWTYVAQKTEDGSFFLYLYGSEDPLPMIEKLSPFDGALGFFDEQDPQWDEYAALREILDQGRAMPADAPEPAAPVESTGDDPPTSFMAPAKPATTKPATNKPATNKPATKKPATNKPAAQKPANKPVAKKPTAKKPARKTAAKKPAAKKPASKTAAKPAAKKPARKRSR